LPWIVDCCRKKASPPFSRSGHDGLDGSSRVRCAAQADGQAWLVPSRCPLHSCTSAVFSLTPLDSTVNLNLLCFTVYKKTAHAYYSTFPYSSFGSSGTFQAYRKFRFYRTGWSRSAVRPGNRGQSPELRSIYFTDAHKNGNFSITLGPRNGLLCATLIHRIGLHCACKFCTHPHASRTTHTY